MEEKLIKTRIESQLIGLKFEKHQSIANILVE